MLVQSGTSLNRISFFWFVCRVCLVYSLLGVPCESIFSLKLLFSLSKQCVFHNGRALWQPVAASIRTGCSSSLLLGSLFSLMSWLGEWRKTRKAVSGANIDSSSVCGFFRSLCFEWFKIPLLLVVTTADESHPDYRWAAAVVAVLLEWSCPSHVLQLKSVMTSKYDGTNSTEQIWNKSRTKSGKNTR